MSTAIEINPRAAPFRRNAFTLTELLVAMAIIALLAVISFSLVNSAIQSSRAAVSSSNLRQMAVAVLNFATDHQGHFPGAQTGIQQNGYTVGWFGGFKSGSDFKPELGPLYSYWGDADISGDPSVENNTREYYGPVDYAYNVLYLGARFHPYYEYPRGIKQAQIRNPAQTVMFHESARLGSGGDVERVPWGYPPSGLSQSWPPGRGFRNPTFHGRHNGYGNVAWADGHVSRMRPVNSRSFGFGPSQDDLEESSIGDIAPPEDPRSDEYWDLE